MPNYEYQCTKCDNLFELWQSVGAAPPECPKCGSEVRKIFHVPRVIFKGSGFYLTDLRAEKAAQQDKQDKKDGKPDAADKSTTKTETATSHEAATPASAEKKPESSPQGPPAPAGTTGAVSGAKTT